MKYRIVKITNDSNSHYCIDKKLLFLWKREGYIAPLAGGDCIGSCLEDYKPIFQVRKFKTLSEAEKYIYDKKHRISHHEEIIKYESV